tara:strand:- start:444 stop:1706 length:1263 start_codon:yes stop_codon:yes gene_type:complete
MAISRGSIQHLIIDDIKILLESLSTSCLLRKASTESKSLTEKEISKFFNHYQINLFPYARTSLYAVLQSLNIDPGSYVLMTPYNIAPMLDIINSLGLKPKFIDINLEDFGPDYEVLEEEMSKGVKCFILTYLFGNVPDISYIMECSKKYGVPVIEDISHNIGASYCKQPLGTFGSAAIYSASLTKYVDGYGGGFVITKDRDLDKKIRAFTKRLKKPNPKRIRKIIFKTLIWNIALNKNIFSLVTYPCLYLLSMIRPNELEKILSGSINKFQTNNLPNYYFEDITTLQCHSIVKYIKKLPDTLNARIQNVRELKLAIDRSRYNISTRNNQLNLTKSENDTFWQYVYKVEDTNHSRKILFKHGIETGITNLPDLAAACNIELKNAKKLKTEYIFIPVHKHLKQFDYKNIIMLLEISKPLSIN